ncbi:MAG: glutamate ligase domain-containing protein, partial [Paludibacter sp.]
GHNVGGIRYVTEQLKAQEYKTLRIIIGMVNDKDVSAVLALLPLKAQYYFTQAKIPRALPAEEMMLQAQSYGLNGMTYKTVEQAITTAINDADSDDFVFIGGSNFVVGEALAYWTMNK